MKKIFAVHFDAHTSTSPGGTHFVTDHCTVRNSKNLVWEHLKQQAFLYNNKNQHQNTAALTFGGICRQVLWKRQGQVDAQAWKATLLSAVMQLIYRESLEEPADLKSVAVYFPSFSVDIFTLFPSLHLNSPAWKAFIWWSKYCDNDQTPWAMGGAKENKEREGREKSLPANTQGIFHVTDCSSVYSQRPAICKGPTSRQSFSRADWAQKAFYELLLTTDLVNAIPSLEKSVLHLTNGTSFIFFFF